MNMLMVYDLKECGTLVPWVQRVQCTGVGEGDRVVSRSRFGGGNGIQICENYMFFLNKVGKIGGWREIALFASPWIRQWTGLMFRQ